MQTMTAPTQGAAVSTFPAGNGVFMTPNPHNETVNTYAPGTAAKKELKAALKRMAGEEIEVPLVIGGKKVTTGSTGDMRMPHAHGHLLGRYHKASKEHVDQAVEAAMAAQPAWAAMPWGERAAIFLRAAEILSTRMRPVLNGATMLGQSKTAHQAEIDSACELIDFLRFNVSFMGRLFQEQPMSSAGMWNRLEHRPLEGFVFAVTPFNFTAIAGNLPTCPAMLGNVVVWKPASSAIYSAHYIMQILEEAGLPAGVINLVPGSGSNVGDPAIANRNLAGLHFTGSTEVFQSMWGQIGANIANYRTYPRIVGETGGKDFVVAHPTAEVEALTANLVRGAFEFQGQKCSAASRAYIAESVWKAMGDRLVDEIKTIKMGDVRDFRNFMGAVIDRSAFDRIKGYIEFARSSNEAEILAGGKCDDSEGYFVEPTLIKTSNPRFKLMEEEIFGPVLTVYVYPDNQFDEVLQLCDQTSPYALTGAIFARERTAILQASNVLRNAAGNFYINDKPTGAVVGQQPFGGARGSGTNDKAGSILNLLRWVSPRTVKETFTPVTNYRYSFLDEE
ncbi:MAG: L-glutamate gamma-semialdehyde dehydrogenase [Vulcanimicrobiota bacterium]